MWKYVCDCIIFFSDVEVVIWLRDQKGIHVNLEGNGQLAEAADLFEIVKEHRKLPDFVDNIFSIWMVSPLLGKYIFKKKNNNSCVLQ